MLKLILINQYFFSIVAIVFFTLQLLTPTAYAESKPLKQNSVTGKSLGAVETEYPSWFHDGFLDFKEDLAIANAKGKRLLLLFTQDGCPYCNALVERNLAQKDIEELVRSKFEVIAINLVGDREVTNIDGKRYTEKTYAEALKVQFTPTMLFFNDKGETILRLNGYLPPEQFKVALNYLVEKNNQLTFRDFLELNAPPAQAGKLNKESFFLLPPYNLQRKVSQKAKPIAVFFEQKDCPNCDVLHKQVLVDTETRKLIAQYDAVQLDMWDKATAITTPEGKASTARDWAKKLDIKYAPTIVLFDEAGNEIIRTEAFFKIFHIQSFFDYVQSGACKQQPNFQRYISHRSEQLRAQGKDVDIWRMNDEGSSQ
jgi:thioredoxin-related protein